MIFYMQLNKETHICLCLFVLLIISTSEFATRHIAGDEKVIISEGFRSAKLVQDVDGS